MLQSRKTLKCCYSNLASTSAAHPGIQLPAEMCVTLHSVWGFHILVYHSNLELHFLTGAPALLRQGRRVALYKML